MRSKSNKADKALSTNKNGFSEFITLPVKLDLKLTISYKDMNDLVYRIVDEGIGTWGQVINAKVYKVSEKRFGQHIRRSKKYYDFPITILDTNEDETYKIDKETLLTGIKEAWIDFPFVLDTTCGYDLKLRKLKASNIDEVIQLVLFGEIKYDLCE